MPHVLNKGHLASLAELGVLLIVTQSVFHISGRVGSVPWVKLSVAVFSRVAEQVSWEPPPNTHWHLLTLSHCCLFSVEHTVFQTRDRHRGGEEINEER